MVSWLRLMGYLLKRQVSRGGGKGGWSLFIHRDLAVFAHGVIDISIP